jgi:hypothetical protein
MGRICGACVREKRNTYRVLVRKPAEKRPLGRPRRGWKIVLEWFLKK